MRTESKGAAKLPRPGDSAPVLPPSLRIPFIRRCQINLTRGEQSGLMMDLSLAGAYVECKDLLAVRDSTILSFKVPGNDRTLRLPAVVIWVNSTQVHPVHSLPPGCGLRFLEVKDPDQALISRTILDYCLRNPLYRQYL
jgi:Tfp pilus assembly protein PilZ